ncbi:MAG: WD40 repeat domain-containing protein, partial [Ralstonia sp.]
MLRCSWSADGTKISAGSADRFVYIWDTTSRRIIYKLPGHNGSVNEVVFHPKEPIGEFLKQIALFHFHETFLFSQWRRPPATDRFTWAKSNLKAIHFQQCLN